MESKNDSPERSADENAQKEAIQRCTRDQLIEYYAITWTISARSLGEKLPEIPGDSTDNEYLSLMDKYERIVQECIDEDTARMARTLAELDRYTLDSSETLSANARADTAFLMKM